MQVEGWKRDNWLHGKSREMDVVTLPSGLMYKKKISRYCGKSAVPKSTCVCHYIGSLYTGKIFDSSYERGEPITISPESVIKGWSEALQLMKEGEKWELYVPSKLGYGVQGQEPFIPSNCPLIFTLELLKVEGESKKLSSI